jgi:hypothetical protein
MPPELKENRIPTHTAGFMLAVAAFFDLLQIFFNLILIGFLINWTITLISFLTFFVWFKLYGVNLGDSAKKIALWLTDYAFDIFSGGIFPSIFISTLITILIVKSDDALRNQGIDLNLSTSASYRKKVAENRRAYQASLQSNEEGSEVGEEESPERFKETLSRVSRSGAVPGNEKGAATTRVPLTSSAPTVIPNNNQKTENNSGILGRINRTQNKSSEPYVKAV